MPRFGDIELWVADLDATTKALSSRLGFTPRDRVADDDDLVASVGSGPVTVHCRQGATSSSITSRFVAEHGDGIADVEIVCDPTAVQRASALGLETTETARGIRIDMTGDGTIHHTVRRPPPEAVQVSTAAPIGGVDHVALCLPAGQTDSVATAYRAVFGLTPIEIGALTTVGSDETGMHTAVVRDGDVTFVLTEPRCDAGAGQTQRFIDAHGGPGMQHVAFAYDDLIASLAALRTNGDNFRPAPNGYHAQARERLALHSLPWAQLEGLGVLVDADTDGLLYQILTKPMSGPDSYFFELIQRDGAQGFGEYNVRALFDALDTTRAG